MAVTYNTAVKTARMTATRDYFANGAIEILTAADSVLATFGLDADGGDISGAIWTLVLDASTVEATGAGTAAKARIKTSGGDAHLTGLTVGMDPEAEPPTDIVLDNTNIATGQEVLLSSATITHAA